METVHEWNDKIIQLIDVLNKWHPELLGFLDEMPITEAITRKFKLKT
jgi:hypothetical protein